MTTCLLPGRTPVGARGTGRSRPRFILARSAKATARITIARISRSDPTNRIGARDVIEDVEDRINGFAAEVRFAQPLRTRNAELDKRANRQNREIAMAAIAPHRCHKRNAVTTRARMAQPRRHQRRLLAGDRQYPLRNIQLRQGACIIKRHDGEPTPEPPKAPSLNSWSAHLIGGKKMQLLGTLEAVSEAAAIEAAVALFGLNDQKRSRLAVNLRR
jgi:hypothetical protein